MLISATFFLAVEPSARLADIYASNSRPPQFHNAGCILHISTFTDSLVFESDKAHSGWRHQAVLDTGLSTASCLRNFGRSLLQVLHN